MNILFYCGISPQLPVCRLRSTRTRQRATAHFGSFLFSLAVHPSQINVVALPCEIAKQNVGYCGDLKGQSRICLWFKISPAVSQIQIYLYIQKRIDYFQIQKTQIRSISYLKSRWQATWQWQCQWQAIQSLNDSISLDL